MLSVISWHNIAPTASPLGEEEPGPGGAERGGYSPIPRRDARAGEWVTWRRISGAEHRISIKFRIADRLLDLADSMSDHSGVTGCQSHAIGRQNVDLQRRARYEVCCEERKRAGDAMRVITSKHGRHPISSTTGDSSPTM